MTDAVLYTIEARDRSSPPEPASSCWRRRRSEFAGHYLTPPLAEAAEVGFSVAEVTAMLQERRRGHDLGSHLDGVTMRFRGHPIP